MFATAIGTGLAIMVGLHLATAGLTARRYLRSPSRRRTAAAPEDLPFISLIRPVCGVDTFDHETLKASFSQDYPDYEILFCAASEADPAVQLVRDLIASHPEANARILIGDDPISANPKLNNVVKGYDASQAEFICMTDSNLMLPPDYLRQLMATWQPGTGVVSAPAAGSQPGNFWGAVECAFLNTDQARWQLAADSLGFGFAQGKTLFFHRPVIEAGGGLAALGNEMAEDLATTKLVRGQGLKVRLAPRLFAQPVGERSFHSIWSRQVRWSRIRRDGVWAVFVLEALQGSVAPLVLLTLLVVMGQAPGWSIPALAVYWYGVEYLLARIAGWPAGPRDLAAMVTRDALLPAIWLATWRGRDISWRGTHIPASDTERTA